MIKVLKFGGTSVGSAENMKKVAAIVRDEKATVVVLSAMLGTTDALIRVAKAAEAEDLETVDMQLDMLHKKYSDCINGLSVDKNEAFGRLDSMLKTIRKEVADYKEYSSERIIIAQGELCTSAIFALYMNEAGIKAQWLSAPQFMTTGADDKVDTVALRNYLHNTLKDDGTMYVTQGFISTNYRGEMDNLGRGGSDYSAALIGAAINAGQVQIWTDIDGMHNNDPRYVDNTYPIRNMSFDEAAELAYFGAKILHPSTIQPCKDNGIAVLLKNTMDPSAPGTTISDKDDDQSSFHAVAAKDNITVIRIYSARMLMAYGFLRKVFEIFESHRTPIDMITTSEVAVSLTIDNDAHLGEIQKELETLGKIEIERDNSIVCVVGNIGRSNAGLAAKIFGSVQDIPLKMISYGASHRSMVMLIDTENKKQTLQALNDRLFK